MDRNEDDMKFVGFFGIFKQSFKTIFSSLKLFTLITLTSILPLTVIFLADLKISNDIFWRIDNNLVPYETNDSRKTTALDWLYYWLYDIAYFIFLIIFSLLSTAAVVFTVASVYVNRDVTFRQVVKIIPKIWKKTFVTFVFIYLALFIYNVMLFIVMAIVKAIFGGSALGLVIAVIILVIYLLGFLYLTVVCQLASVVTVLENVYGFSAMKKGKYLANGKKKVGMAMAFAFSVVLGGLVLVLFVFVEHGDEVVYWKLVWRVLLGILVGFLVMVLFLLVIVTQTVLYLVCKSWHREAIDKLSLATFLGAYSAETVEYPKPGEEIQLGRSPRSQIQMEQV